MPRSCCVPGCKSNYTGEYTPIFSFPSDEERVNLWKRKIPRENLTITRNTGVCIIHFPEDQIVREIRATRADGTELVVPRKKLDLTSDAVPSIFPNLPKYLTADNRVHRKDPEERRQTYIENENRKYIQWLSEDEISNLDQIVNNESKYNHLDWIVKGKNEKLYFMNVDFSECASLKRSVTIDKDLKLSIIVDGINIEVGQFSYILGPELLCNSYSKLVNLLTAVNSLEGKDVTIKDKIRHIQAVLKECIDVCEESRMKAALNFISEQLALQISNQMRYSVDTLVFACSFFYSFPAAYRFLRNLEILVLPHPSYLKTFSLSNISSGVNGPLKKYLKVKCDALEAHEKLVCLLLDEIYVKPKITYKGNKIVGMARNSLDLTSATTVQTFMIKSILSKQKDVVALLPVKNVDADFLYQSVMNVLHTLHEAGYEVVAVIADNAKVNVKCYKLLSSDSVIHPFIANPCDSQKKCFLLFDTVHLLKNLRNNWLNERDSTFIYPSMNDVSTIQLCKFQDVRRIYEDQKLHLVKHAPGLSFRVCYPNSFERQNVNYAVALFDDKTIAAMSTIQGAEGTKDWLQIIRKWWMVVNVKHLEKGIRLREKYAEPIRNMDQESVQYLYSFCSWLKNWNDIVIIDSPKSCGKLSRETFSALLHTTETLIKLCKYLLNDLKLHYVLLGTFQTDDLEQRFGKYRQMSGCNYNVSVQQIIESERKIKVTNLLRLKSRQAILNVSEMIKDINAASDQDISSEFLLPAEYDNVINESEEVEMESSTLEIIIFLAGYVSFKVSLRCECLMCKSTLITASDLMCELPPEVSYLNHLNRGGLKYPSSFSLEIGIQAYKIFEVLVSDSYKMLFLYSDDPKSVFNHLVLEAMQLSSSAIVCECGKTLAYLAGRCVTIWANIFLNNFSKNQTNVCVEESGSKRSWKDSAGSSKKKTRKAAVFMDI